MPMANNRPIRMWPGTIVLQCPPCSWGKCVFCGFSKDCLTQTQPSTHEFLDQLDSYFQKHGILKHLEIYNSGSYLDDKQISPGSRIAMFKDLHDRGVQSVTIESRPEYIRDETLAPLIAEFKGDLTVAIGLEVADDEILGKLRKGFSLHDVEKALSVLKSLGLTSRAYLLVGAPFIRDTAAAALDSVKWAQKLGFDETSLLAAYPMEGSEGYRLWKSGEWFPVSLTEFDRIVALAKEVNPKLDSSFHDFEGGEKMAGNLPRWGDSFRLGDLDNMWESMPGTPGVYVVYSLKTIPRAGGVDKSGILYIGKSQNLRNRLWTFWDAEHEASGLLWMNLSQAAKLLGAKRLTQPRLSNLLSDLLVRVATPVDPQMLEIAERSVLYTYANTFGELPPLNSALPKRWEKQPRRQYLNWARNGIRRQK